MKKKRKRPSIRKQFNWRMLLVRIIVNAFTLLIVAILPGIYFVEPTVLRVLFVAVILGILNAVLKPIVQFLTLRFIFITFGLAVLVINIVVLLALNILLPNMFAVDSLFWAIIGGVLMGLVASLLEALFGLQMPIVEVDIGVLATAAIDPSLALRTKIVDGVTGPNAELAEEVPLVDQSSEREPEVHTPERGEER